MHGYLFCHFVLSTWIRTLVLSRSHVSNSLPLCGTLSLSSHAILLVRLPFLLPAPATMQHRWESPVWFLSDVLFPQLMEYGFMKSVCLALAIMVRWFIEPCSVSSFIFCAVVLFSMGSSVFGSKVVSLSFISKYLCLVRLYRYNGFVVRSLRQRL